MRYYQTDGTFQEDPKDVEFGWFFSDIAIDEAATTFKGHNEKMRDKARLRKSLALTKSSARSSKSTESFKRAECSENADDDIEESIDVVAEMESFSKQSYLSKTMDESIDIEVTTRPQIIYKIEPNVKIAKVTNSISYHSSVEGFIENPETNFYKQIKNSRVPSKEEMMSLINPINPESKALLSVVSYSKYRSLNEKETNDSVLRTINFKTTNSNRIIGDFDSPFKNGSVDISMDRERFPDFNFVLNDGDLDVDQQLASEIQNYNATKEDNMLSLMMELIITDMDSNLGDMSELNNSVNELNSIVAAMETSDLGNSIHSSLMSKEGNGSKDNRLKRSNHLDIPNRSDILSSIGLSDDIDKSIENFTKEKSEMYQQLCDIKKSFKDDEKKVENLINQAIYLQNDLRETTYLDNLIHLLNGKPEKVTNKKLPFRIFHKPIDDDNDNSFNLII